MATTRITAVEIDHIGNKMVPGNPISIGKLMQLTGYPRDKIYAFRRHLAPLGLLTSESKRGQGSEATLFTLHKKPVPESQRDTISTRPGRALASKQCNGLFKSITSYEIKGGTYTADELEPLLRKVAKDLGFRLVTP